MEPPKKIPTLSKAILAGVITGIIATVVAIIYNILYRAVTNYFSTAIVNFFSTVLSSILVIMIVSLAYYFVVKNADRPNKVFSYCLLALTVVAIAAVLFSSHSHAFIFAGDKGLIAGHILIGGMLAAFLVPYFYHHPRIFI
jgi:magnesium-transporting ATPase (P-type)